VTAVVVLLAVMIMACVAMMKAREIVGDGGLSLLRYQTKQRINITASLVTESLTAYQYFNEGALQIAVEFVRDRIVGYPYDGYEDDQHVPFLDTDTNTNRYPLKGFPVPLDWQVDFNINNENRQEHLQGRWDWAFDGGTTDKERELYKRSSLSGSFFFQGTCDPSSQPGSSVYAPNCTKANNDISTGGVVSPNNTTRFLHEKSAELQILLKALHESHYAAFSIVIHFFNNGAGATLQYPGMISDRNFTYKSGGCDWMRTTNNFTGRPFATEEQIRNCHPKGEDVPGYEYNPWEEHWLALSALYPQATQWKSASENMAYNSGHTSVSPVSRSVIDRK
jgi:hypothetical protein